MTTRIKLRRDVSSNWNSANPVLALGEPGYDITNNKLKIGDGVTAWNTLTYLTDDLGIGILTNDGDGNLTWGSVDPDIDLVSDWQDGINDNVWRIVNVGGTKSFNFISEGYKEIIMTAVDSGSSSTSVVFDSLEYEDLDDFDWNISNAANTYNLYIGEDQAITLTSVSYVKDGNNFTFNFDPVNWNVNDKFVIKYWTEGTVSYEPDYDYYDEFYVTTDFLNTNTINVNSLEFNINAPWADFTNNVTKHSIRFNNLDGESTLRKITSVEDVGDGTYNVTFNGPLINVLTVSSSTISTATITNSGSNTDIMFISRNQHPDFGDAINGYFASTSYVLTGGVQRSGYLTINGGSPIDFIFAKGTSSNNGDWSITLSTTATWTPSDTIDITWYREYMSFEIGFYVPNNVYWNNGHYWLNWKDDFPEWFSNTDNGIDGGTGKVMCKVYDVAENEGWMVHSQFGWAGRDWDSYVPYDPYDSSNLSDKNADLNYPFHSFNSYGIKFKSTQVSNGNYSKQLKVRIMYKFELLVTGEYSYWWWC